MAIVQVQHKTGTSVVSANTVAVTVTATTLGNLIIVGVGGSTTDTVSSVTDNATGGSNTYTQVTSARATDSGGTARWCDVWFCANCKAGATTVTITVGLTNTNRKSAYVHEVSGMATASPVDGSAGVSNNIASSATITGPSVTTTNTNDYVFGVLRTAGTANNTGAGNSFINDDADNAGASVHEIVSVTGTYNPTYSLSLGGTACASTVAFKDPGTGTVIPKYGTSRLLMGVGT